MIYFNEDIIIEEAKNRLPCPYRSSHNECKVYVPYHKGIRCTNEKEENLLKRLNINSKDLDNIDRDFYSSAFFLVIFKREKDIYENINWKLISCTKQQLTKPIIENIHANKSNTTKY